MQERRAARLGLPVAQGGTTPHNCDGQAAVRGTIARSARGSAGASPSRLDIALQAARNGLSGRHPTSERAASGPPQGCKTPTGAGRARLPQRTRGPLACVPLALRRRGIPQLFRSAILSVSRRCLRIKLGGGGTRKAIRFRMISVTGRRQATPARGGHHWAGPSGGVSRPKAAPRLPWRTS